MFHKKFEFKNVKKVGLVLICFFMRSDMKNLAIKIVLRRSSVSVALIFTVKILF